MSNADHADALLAFLDATFAADDAATGETLDALEVACVAKVRARDEYVREAKACGLMLPNGRYAILHPHCKRRMP